MSTQQQIRLDIKQIKPEAMNLFYAGLLQQIVIAKDDPELYQEYLESKKGGSLFHKIPQERVRKDV